MGASSARLDYDYFLKDHLGNVRMVLTDEQETSVYPAATLEGSLSSDGTPNAAYVEKNYYAIDAANVVDKPLGIPDYFNNNCAPPYNNNPNSVTTAISEKMYRLQGTSGGAAIGLGSTIRVMSGDKIDIFGKSFYQVDNINETNYSLPVLNLLSGFLGGPSGIGVAKGVAAAGLNGIGSLATAVGNYLSHLDRGAGTRPKAYINYILLDDQFRYVSGSFSRVGSIDVIKSHYEDLHDIAVTENGYLYVYCSNESPVQVFFDNLQVIHTKGPLLEETHYYPFGLAMAGISSKSAGDPSNKLKYNGKEEQREEFKDGSGLEWLDYGARMYDNQIGRWMAVDPMSESYISYSVYNFTLNNPVNLTDQDGKGVTGDYYKMDGTYLGKDNKVDDKVYLVENDAVKTTTDSKGVTTNKFATSKVTDLTQLTGITHTVFQQIAAFAFNETYPNHDLDKFRVANSIANRIDDEKQDPNKYGIIKDAQKTVDELRYRNDSHEARMGNEQKLAGTATAAYAKFFQTLILLRNNNIEMKTATAANALSVKGIDYTQSLDGAARATQWRGAQAGTGNNGRYFSAFPISSKNRIANFKYDTIQH